jgi:transcriptional regulator with XRE-family HTH domain
VIERFFKYLYGQVKERKGNTMRTSLGDCLRKIRMENNQRLKDMADVLDVTSAFLSAVENGKKLMPATWYKKLKMKYNLDNDSIEELKQYAMESQKSISLNIENVTDEKKELAVVFARSFEKMDKETSRKILRLLSNKRGKET